MKRNLLSTIVLIVISLCLFMTACDSEVYQNGDITFALAKAIDIPVNVYIDGNKVATISAGSKSTTVNILASTFKPGSIVYTTTYTGDLEGAGNKSYEIGYTVGYDVNLPIRGTASVTMTIADSRILDSYTVTSPADNESGEVVDSAYLITAFKGSGDTVIFPSTIEGKAVSVASHFVTSEIKNVYVSYGASVGDSAFSGNTNIEQVTIASDNIGSNAFRDCTGINSVVFTGPVKSIGAYAFYGCTSLTTLKFNSSVSIIGERAFSMAPIAETDLELNGISEIGKYAFGVGNTNTGESHRLTGVLTINVPAGEVLEIKENAFRVYDDNNITKNSTISKIVINGNVNIYRDAFLYLSESSVLINGDVSYIGLNAFNMSTNLENFEIRGNLENYEKNGSIFLGTPLAKDPDRQCFYTANEKFTLDSSGSITKREPISTN